MHCIGRVYCDADLLHKLDIHRRAGMLPRGHVDEIESVWDIDGDIWRYRLAVF